MPIRLAAALALVLLACLPARAQDPAEMVVRMTRLENQMRQMAGQVEQLQFENRQLRDQLRKFQEDVEFRFQERGGAAPRAASPGPSTQTPPAPSRPAPSQPVPPQRRGDAFDPAQDPGAPGAPRPLGTTPPSASLPSAAPGAPLRMPETILSETEEDDELPPGVRPPLDLNDVRQAPPPAAPAQAQPAAAPRGPNLGTGTGDARADYDAAYAYLLQRQYEQAEMAFRRFLQSYPRDRLVPDATYWLGESYLQRNRSREAAEQFLAVSTEHPQSGKAPDSMLKLGIALNALGARDRACAVFAELDRKYPQAVASVRQGSEREQKRARCVG